MLRKKFIFETDEEKDVDEMSDYEKIIRLAKGRLSPREVYFEDSNGKDYGDIIEVTYDGLIFTFDGLSDYLKFFFPEEYGEDNTDGEWDARNYEAMYSGNWSWYDDFNDRDYEDWREGHVTERFRKNHLELVRDIARFLSPTIYLKISTMLKEGSPLDSVLNIEIRDFLDTINLGDNITEAYTDANYAAVVDEVPKGIEDTYCNCLKNVGVERYSQKYCFWKYEMDWGSCVMLFARFGTDEDNFLDLLFNSIKKEYISHLPEYYEMQYNFWDAEKFESTWNSGVEEVLERKLEDIQTNTENYNEKYKEIIDKVSQLGGINNWITTKDKKYQIFIDVIDQSTGQITYKIKKPNDWSTRVGKTDIDGIINIIYNEKLFNMMEHLDRFSILRNKTFL